jgi:hypothetical protein
MFVVMASEDGDWVGVKVLVKLLAPVMPTGPLGNRTLSSIGQSVNKYSALSFLLIQYKRHSCASVESMVARRDVGNTGMAIY